MQQILIVDDDAGHRLMLEALLKKWGFSTRSAQNGQEAVTAVLEQPYDTILMDLRMPDMDGITALKHIHAHNPAIPVIMMTAYSDVESAVEAVKSGAYEYLTKPLDFDRLKLTLNRTLEHSALKNEVQRLRTQDSPYIVGKSEAVQNMLSLIQAVAPSEATVLITGRSGTGKELVARAIHEQSSRKNKPLVAVNCAALAESLLESELFGHEKGAFTGADKRREGKFLQAQGGTIFLDEIGEVSPLMQVKLLRVLQQREIQRVGGDETITVDVRVVASTNRDLEQEIREGRFREDLYYRLNVVAIVVPSLQERSSDIPLLAQHFLEKYSVKNHKTVKGFTPAAMDMLVRYPWPGNVRELENAVERAVVLLMGEYIGERELPESITRNTSPAPAVFPEQASLEDMERLHILRVLEISGDNKSEAAKRLGISRKTLHTKLKQYGV